jgi:hypothetical protein
MGTRGLELLELFHGRLGLAAQSLGLDEVKYVPDIVVTAASRWPLSIRAECTVYIASRTKHGQLVCCEIDKARNLGAGHVCLSLLSSFGRLSL